MLDKRFVRENLEIVEKAIELKNEKGDVKRFIQLDDEARKYKKEIDDLRSERNRLSQEVSKLKRAKENADQVIEQVKKINEDIKEKEENYNQLLAESEEILSWIPNVPHHTVPKGKGEEDNREVRKWGEIREFDFEPKAHYDIGDEMDILDFERAAKISGARFSLLKGQGAKLERALIDFMIDVHTEENGYREVAPPYIVGYDTMYATGQLPKLAEDMYTIEKDSLYLIPTAEVPVTNLHRDEILKEEVLPLCYVAYTPCFRRESGTYGKDTRGLIRVHQFNKVEMVKIVKPEHSYEELEKLTANAEKILRMLELPYRVVELCTGDLSFSAAKCYDIEVWFPSQNKYREISSCSNFEDFQARRGKIRFRRNENKQTEFAHTLNGSGLAIGRTMAAILENYQTPDGKFEIPHILKPYFERRYEI